MGLTAFFSYPLLQYVARTVVRDIFFPDVKMKAEEFDKEELQLEDDSIALDPDAVMPYVLEDGNINTPRSSSRPVRRYCCRGYGKKDNLVFYLSTTVFLIATTSVSIAVADLQVRH